MEKIKGIQLPNLSFTLKKMGDLITYEGPIFSHFVSNNEDDFLFFWVESDDTFNRWMVYKTNSRLLNQFFQKQLSNFQLIQNAPDGFAYFIDIDDEIEYQKIQVAAIADIPKNYFPSKDSFFDEEHFEDYAQKLKTYLEFYFSRKKAAYQPPEISTTLVAQEPPVNYKSSKK